jgi:hypothetical protein
MDTIAVPLEEYKQLKEKAEAYDKISQGNSAKGKASASKLTPEERSERAKKAVEARIAKYGQAKRK